MPTDPESAAADVLALVQAGRFEEVRDRFSARLRPLVGADELRAAWDGAVAQLGDLRSTGAPVTGPTAGGLAVVTIPLTFERGPLDLVVSVGGDGSLGGIQLAPAGTVEGPATWQPPSYMDLATFVDEDVILGAGPLAVPGTLSRPRGSGPGPGVVLLGGSGPTDRDGTVGANKPLKDLA